MGDDTNRVPSVTKTAFNCPYCGVYAKQSWFNLYAIVPPDAGWTPYGRKSNSSKVSELLEKGDILVGKLVLGSSFQGAFSGWPLHNVYASSCSHCREVAVWVNKKMAHPPEALSIQPNQDLPDDIKSLFEEARQVAPTSPRSAAALLRLCVDKLCSSLGETGRSLNDSIANLVKRGLPPDVQKMLDYVRVIGNDAVHPGKLDAGDKQEHVHILFKLVNLIAEKMISEQKQVERLYNSLPEDARSRIERRDNAGVAK